MPTTAVSSRRKTVKAAPKEIVLSVRIDAETVGMLDELATEMDRSRSAVAARAIREYAEQEYATLCAAREGEKDIAKGKWVSTAEARAWMKDRIAGRKREPKYGR
jgi:predicted transcriptional regulator